MDTGCKPRRERISRPLATSVDLFWRVAIDARFDTELASTRMSAALDSFVLSALQTELALIAGPARALVYDGFEVLESPDKLEVRFLNWVECGIKIPSLRLQMEVGSSRLLAFKHEGVRLTLADRAHGPGQRLEFGGKLDLLGPRDLALDLVGDFQSALIQPAR